MYQAHDDIGLFEIVMIVISMLILIVLTIMLIWCIKKHCNSIDKHSDNTKISRWNNYDVSS